MTSAKRDFFLHDCRRNPCHVTGPKNTVREYFLDSSFPPPIDKKTFEMSSSIKKLLDHAQLGWEHDEAHFLLNGYVNKQNCRIWSEANPQVYVETPLHPEKLTVWCVLWAGGILLQKR
ncbi:hypothetical protein TNCV_4094891 [Trichonephila clavipes]|uniref:Uncharacterized protein n=1 Tax=Trichonephila clavipes TaxID=2585209 RepID=A0A8X6S6B2_TRICX|nr:hypothetical protein TNCV_4094891 [Trichonephila clavipes]